MNLAPGLLESVYEAALSYELSKTGVHHSVHLFITTQSN